MQHDSQTAWLDALHLASASLPIGGFAYSQGLEYACDIGKIKDVAGAQRWIEDYLVLVIGRQELPWWQAIYTACANADWQATVSLSDSLSALRETAELRLESAQMAHAMVKLYEQWLDGHGDVDLPEAVKQSLAHDYTAAHAGLCALRQLPEQVGMTAWLWAWLDNQVLAAVKLVPLGQRHGQEVLHALKSRVPDVISQAKQIPIEQCATGAIGLMIASSRHETQYARLFRS